MMRRVGALLVTIRRTHGRFVSVDLPLLHLLPQERPADPIRSREEQSDLPFEGRSRCGEEGGGGGERRDR